MTGKVDNWEKPRSRGQHLSEAEIAQLKADYVLGRTSTEAARELKCSSRVASKYFSFFKAEGVAVKGPTVSLRPRAHTSVSDGAFPISRSKLMAGR